MTKAEKNYKRDYGHKDSAELALNYTRDGMRTIFRVRSLTSVLLYCPQDMRTSRRS